MNFSTRTWNDGYILNQSDHISKTGFMSRSIIFCSIRFLVSNIVTYTRFRRGIKETLRQGGLLQKDIQKTLMYGSTDVRYCLLLQCIWFGFWILFVSNYPSVNGRGKRDELQGIKISVAFVQRYMYCRNVGRYDLFYNVILVHFIHSALHLYTYNCIIALLA